MTDPATIPVAILCGGRGTRLQEHTRSIPKALVEIGGMPIVEHVIRIYAAQGFERFHLLTGYKGEMIEDWLAGNPIGGGLDVRTVETGIDTPTGGRIKLAAESLDGEVVCATYADGVADINLAALLDRHAQAGVAATMTVVQPYNQWGVAQIAEDGLIHGFIEKPRTEYWINGGFFCFGRTFFSYLETDSVLEQHPLASAAADGALAAYRHEGFWECMDTYKDATQLNDLWASGSAPWKLWDGEGDLSSPSMARGGIR